MCKNKSTDHSYGIIPIRREKNEWEVLLVRHGKGHWGFPKGHADPGEEPHQAAIRELREETGLEVVRFLDTHPTEERYSFYWKGHLIDKTVLYFLAEIQGEVIIQADEISDFRWQNPQQAAELATFNMTKQCCLSLQVLLTNV